MMRQMCWLSRFGKSEEKILHLRTASHEAWRPYTTLPQYAVPDYRIPGGSKGWATYQKLMKAGWVLIPSATETATEYKELAINELESHENVSSLGTMQGECLGRCFDLNALKRAGNN